MKKIIAAVFATVLTLTVVPSHADEEVYEPCGPSNGELQVWTKAQNNGEQIKFYAKYPQPGQKIQFMVQNSMGEYEEHAWIRIDSEDLSQEGNYKNLQNEIYFIRTLDLEPGKNRVRILVDGERVWGTKTYTQKPPKDENPSSGEQRARGYYCNMNNSGQEEEVSDEETPEEMPAAGGGFPGNIPDGAEEGDFRLTGQAQKGPLIFGSQVLLTELDSNLEPNGRVFISQTTDDLGRFSISSNVTSSLVEIYANGYYFDEIGGALSGAPISLNAIADLSVDTSPTLNILTTLQAPRMKTLIADGAGYRQAAEQSTREVLDVFGIDADDINGFDSLFSMTLDGDSDQDSVLLATTAIMSQVATSAITVSDQSQAAYMTFFLSRIGADLELDGVLDNEDIQERIRVASSQVDLGNIRTNIESYYLDRGITLTTPLFEEWIDKDNSGVLPQRRSNLENISFTALSDQYPYTQVTSSTVRFDELEDGVDAQVSLASSGATIVKNGQPVTGQFTTVDNDDEVFLTTETLGFGETKRVVFNVGSGLTSWAVTTKSAELLQEGNDGYRCRGGYSESGGLIGDQSSTLFAAPIQLDSAASGNYAGVGITWYEDYYFEENQTDISNLSIFDDNNGEPGALIASSEITRHQSENRDSPYYDSSNLECNSRSPQAYFEDGFTLEADTLYWIVLELTDPIAPRVSGSYTPPYMEYEYTEFWENPVGPFQKRSNDGSTWERWYTYEGGGSGYRVPGWFIGK